MIASLATKRDCQTRIIVLVLTKVGIHSAQWGWPLSETFFREDFLAAKLTCRDRR